MENILSINLGVSTAPMVQEVHGKDYVEYGTDDWRNLYPQFLIDLYYNSSTNAAIINATSELIAGEDIVIDDENEADLERIVGLKQFMASPNSKETLHELTKKLAFDFKLQGAFAINVVWSKDRTKISEIYHIPVEKIRVEKPNEMGRVEGYYVSADWNNTRKNKPYRVPAFNTHDRTSANQILYTGLYSPNMSAYHTPDYLAGNNWSLIDQKVAEFHLNNINSGFSGSYVFSFANGVPTQEERFQIENSIADKFTGSENAGKFILTFSDDKTRTPEITPITTSDLDKQYLALQELLVQNILTAHRVTSPMLMGIKNETGLGSNVDELNAAGNYYLNTVCMPYQQHLIKTFRKIFQVNNIDMPISFVQIKPITLEFTSEDLKAVMTQDEIREELGLAPLNEEVEVQEDFAKVGSMVTDGVELPLFDSIEEAEAEAKKIGCNGYHEHKQDGKTYYMPCESHEQITNLNKCNCKTELSKFTELHKFIDEYGEDIPEEWEMLDEEIVDGEHQDFDFEKELNNIANEKVELASTGTARPNARSEQDGVNKDFSDFYKVRYIYTKVFPGSPSSSRDFCRLMISANKVYRKEDIIQMENKAVNPGFGPRGADTYSIWLYKGGAVCYHAWRRRIYKTSLRGAKSPINDDQIITATKARSEGFTIEKNDDLVARAPKSMKNEGFLEPR
tara:strand:+ start:1270 stop:3309 length:2040 start_codon:yes stop_codon:yes gene_type:complete